MNKTIDLNGKWALRWYDGDRGAREVKGLEDPADQRRAIPATVPGAVHLDLNGERTPADNFFDILPGQPYTMAWPSRTPPRILFIGNQMRKL